MAKDYLGINLNQSFTYRQQQVGNLSNNSGGGNGGGTGSGVLNNKKSTPTNNPYSWDSNKKIDLTTPFQKVLNEKVTEKLTGKKVDPNHKIPYERAKPKQKKATQPVQQTVQPTQESQEGTMNLFPIYKKDKFSYTANLINPILGKASAIARAHQSPYQKKVEDYARKIGIPLSRIPKNAGRILEDYNLTDDEQIRRLLANIAHESEGLTRFKESFYYRDPARIRSTFSSAFNAVKGADPKDYIRNHEKLAAFVYSPETPKGRELGNKSLEDGLNFAGKGPIQLTGRNLYQEISDDTGRNYIDNPDLLLNPEDGFLSAVSYWKTQGIDKIKTPEAARKRVNPSRGFEDTMNYYKKLSEAQGGS